MKGVFLPFACIPIQPNGFQGIRQGLTGYRILYRDLSPQRQLQQALFWIIYGLIVLQLKSNIQYSCFAKIK
ncbi:hypothetical protein XI25_30670 [Paenibacillus sp. DMB20]|nr:hypothetical protein XI25_30670 [Paenibacillus sp. DMB20]